MIFNRPKTRNLYSQKGITLVELIVFIVVTAILIPPLSAVIGEAMLMAGLPEHLDISSFLARKEIENTVNQQFSAISAVSETSYTGNFSRYSYEISVDYVNSEDLNTAVAGPTDYRRVTITIRRTGFPSFSVVTLVTNN